MNSSPSCWLGPTRLPSRRSIATMGILPGIDIAQRQDELQQLLDEKGLQRAQVVRAAGLNETHGYQIFVGTRRGSRDKMLALAFAMGLSLQETNRLLQAAQVNELYCKGRRDAIIIFCLEHGCTLQQVDEELYRFGEDTISVS